MLTNGVSLAVVSKTLRPAQVGITANLYGHLTPEAAHSAADSLGGVLDAAAAKLVADRALRGCDNIGRPDAFSHGHKEAPHLFTEVSGDLYLGAACRDRTDDLLITRSTVASPRLSMQRSERGA